MKDLIRKNKVVLLAVVEHIVNVKSACQISNVAPRWRWCRNYDSNGRGRIWIIWDPNIIKFRPRVTHSQFIYGSVCVEFKFVVNY